MLDVDGPVHVLDFGGDGPPVVFVDGATSCAATWLGVSKGLAPSHRVIAPDLIGHGETPRAGRTATLRADQRLLDRVLDEFGLSNVTLVSITRGGLVAALEAAARPDRILRVVLLEPIAVDRRHIPPLGMLAILPLSIFPRLADRIAVRLFRARDGPKVAAMA
jgi:pimeloyl-ACP methyl ester carboxylesterase